MIQTSFYINRNNSVNITLLKNDIYFDASTLTKVELKSCDNTIDFNSILNPDLISINQIICEDTGLPISVININLGLSGLAVGVYRMHLICYSFNWQNGVIWDRDVIFVIMSG